MIQKWIKIIIFLNMNRAIIIHILSITKLDTGIMKYIDLV
nr:MAG TPA: hypothetical protein [Bacteriophage sp.]